MSTPTASLLDKLGSHVAALELSGVPEAVMRQAKLCILDTIGCMLVGAETGDAAGVVAAETANDPRRIARVIGTSERLSTESAARVNGYNGDIFELNDLIGGHASIGSVSLALAMADSGCFPGSLLLRAVIAGIETTAHVHAGYRETPVSYERTGNAYVGFINTLGASAVASTFLRLDGATTGRALAIAGALAGWCPAQAIFHGGGGIKPMLFGGWPAAVGLMGARYAQHGVTGPQRLLEGELGFLRASAREPKHDAVVDWNRWFLDAPRRKMHACCGFIHPAIELVTQLRRTHGVDVFRGAEIRVSAVPTIVPAISKDTAPTSANDARFHAQYCIALAAAGADVILPEHSSRYIDFLANRDLAELVSAVRIVSDPRLKHYQESQVDVVRDGEVVAHMHDDNPRGSPTNPFSDREVIAKFNRLASSALPAEQIDAFVGRILGLEDETDCQWIASTLEPPRAAAPRDMAGVA